MVRPITVSYSIGEFSLFRVRTSFYSQGNEKSSVYFIDDLIEPLKKSGRIIINSIYDLQRSSYESRSILSHNGTHLYNLIEETYKNIPYPKVENLYDVIVKVKKVG